jgi:hypothetical protein
LLKLKTPRKHHEQRTQSEGKHIFTIRGTQSQKLISHAKSLIAESYGNAAHIQVA